MTVKLAAAAAAVGTLGIAGLVAGSQLVTSSSTTTTTGSIPAPQNLRPVEVGKDYVKVSYGPSIIGPFVLDTPAPDGRSVVVRWGATQDSLFPSGPFSYQYYKNGKLIWSGRNQTYAKVGFTLTVRKFTVCVVPHSPNGFGPKRCTTFTGQ